MARFLFLIFFVLPFACITLPPATDLQKTVILGSPIRKTIFVDRVVLPEEAKFRTEKEDALTLSLIDHLRNFKLFDSVDSSAKSIGIKENNYHILSFRFSEYRREKYTHPAYFPLALVTLCFYIVLGGPIMVDVLSYEGTLEAKDSSGKVVFSTREKFFMDRNENFYTKPVTPPDVEERTALIDKMVNSYAVSIRSKSIQ